MNPLKLSKLFVACLLKIYIVCVMCTFSLSTDIVSSSRMMMMILYVNRVVHAIPRERSSSLNRLGRR